MSGIGGCACYWQNEFSWTCRCQSFLTILYTVRSCLDLDIIDSHRVLEVIKHNTLEDLVRSQESPVQDMAVEHIQVLGGRNKLLLVLVVTCLLSARRVCRKEALGCYGASLLSLISPPLRFANLTRYRARFCPCSTQVYCYLVSSRVRHLGKAGGRSTRQPK
jgi:hypothetical protein